MDDPRKYIKKIPKKTTRKTRFIYFSEFEAQLKAIELLIKNLHSSTQS